MFERVRDQGQPVLEAGAGGGSANRIIDGAELHVDLDEPVYDPMLLQRMLHGRR